MARPDRKRKSDIVGDGEEEGVWDRHDSSPWFNSCSTRTRLTLGKKQLWKKQTKKVIPLNAKRFPFLDKKPAEIYEIRSNLILPMKVMKVVLMLMITFCAVD